MPPPLYQDLEQLLRASHQPKAMHAPASVSSSMDGGRIMDANDGSVTPHHMQYPPNNHAVAAVQKQHGLGSATPQQREASPNIQMQHMSPHSPSPAPSSKRSGRSVTDPLGSVMGTCDSPVSQATTNNMEVGFTGFTQMLGMGGVGGMDGMMGMGGMVDMRNSADFHDITGIESKNYPVGNAPEHSDMVAQPSIPNEHMFDPEQPHFRAHCFVRPFKMCKKRVGLQGNQGNEQYCPNCYCFICDVKASECQGWLRVGHCHANENNLYWKSLRVFTRTEMLCTSPLLTALKCDEEACMEAHDWCVQGLLGFHRYQEGDPGPGGAINHSFLHVANVISAAMKAVVKHLSGPKGPSATLAVLDGITSAHVVSSFRPCSNHSDTSKKHIWSSRTFLEYIAIFEELEKYWVLSITYTSTDCVPPQALAMLTERLRHFSKLASNEITGGIPPMLEPPLTNAISASERGWTHPSVVSIIEGKCTDRSLCEAQTVQMARLRVLERAQRWNEAYHYSIFHGQFVKSIFYMVRASRFPEVIQLVQTQSALVWGAQCLPVCLELVNSGQVEYAVRLAIFCAFRDLDVGSRTEEDQPAQNRLPYFFWLVTHLRKQFTPEESIARNQLQDPPPMVTQVRKDASEMAKKAAPRLAEALLDPLPEPTPSAPYSASALHIEWCVCPTLVSFPCISWVLDSPCASHPTLRLPAFSHAGHPRATFADLYPPHPSGSRVCACSSRQCAPSLARNSSRCTGRTAVPAR